jgi:hypothetical protein
MSRRNRVSVFASFANSGMRDRRAQAISPASSALPLSPFTRKASRSCSYLLTGLRSRDMPTGAGIKPFGYPE